MKLAFVLCTIVLGVTVALPDRPTCSQDPVKNNPICDVLPPGCRIPVCGTDSHYRKDMWFGNGCYMTWYNKICLTDYRQTINAACNRLERPPPSFEPCPWPIRPF